METKHEETYSPEYQRQVRYQFESFCRKVIHSDRCDYLRRILRHMEYETNFSALPEACLDSIGRMESSLRRIWPVPLLHRLRPEAADRVQADGSDHLELQYLTREVAEQPAHRHGNAEYGKTCPGHFGHVFPPKPGVILTVEEEKAPKALAARNQEREQTNFLWRQGRDPHTAHDDA